MFPWVSAFAFALALMAAGAVAAETPPDFEHQITPILARNCVQCHGAEKQKSGLRLDTGAALLRGGDTGPSVIPGAPEESLLYQVVAGLHVDLTMPPEGDGLTDDERAAIRDWIAAGAIVPETETPQAVTSDHWAFQRVADPDVPPVADPWVRNPIDAFVLARLNEAGVTPSPEADRTTLVRRLYLDLVGLPPEPDVIDAFLADDSPAAYEALVDQLLASPHYGERWGRHWLDLARYADSDGYEKDQPRPYAYRYRDWVIDAINEDMPYDEFVIQQLAGDLLPGATLAQRTATGFNRNTLTNREGGIDPEEDRVKQAVDRTNTAGAVFMGLTVGCAQCHSHKYDPISQREYYGLYAFFNAAIEQDIAAPLPGEPEAYAVAVERHKATVAEKQAELDAYKAQLADGLPAWEAALEVPAEGWTILDPQSYLSAGGAAFRKLDDQSLLVVGENPESDHYTVVARSEQPEVKAIRLETLTHDELTYSGPGRSHNGNFVLGEIEIFAAPADAPDQLKPVKIVSATATFAQKDYPIESAFDGDPATGWAIFDGSKTNKDCIAEFMLEEPTGFDGGTLYTIKLAHHYGNKHNIGRFRLALTPNDPANIPYADDVLAALHTPVAERTPAQIDALLGEYARDDETYRKLEEALTKLKSDAPKPVNSIVMALAENPEPPETRIHVRGDFLQPGAPVTAHTPAVLPPMRPRGEQPDRLDLARWIASPENPLTSRVAVNRVWEHLFGDGLERTSEDFGTRTETPTHPALLDWLATRFVTDHRWSTKSLIKQIVLSSTYRQSSHLREELYDRDPANRLIARQNRFRVEAEITRDLFLAASGLLTGGIGGPSIRPPIPDGIVDLGYANSIKWPESEGSDKYRRGLYIFFQRTVAYPMLLAFDCPDSNEAKLSRNRSNTPLQSLTLLNDPVFVEAAQALGRRLLAETPAADLPDRAALAFKWCMGREPRPAELEMLTQLVKAQEQIFESRPEDARTLVGPYLPEGVPVETAAAHMMLARSIMNLDEFVTRE